MAVINSVDKFYRAVIENVILECRELFLDEEVDEAVLAELKQMWERKIKQAKVFEFSNLKPANSSFNMGSYGIIASSRNVGCSEILVPSIHLTAPRGDGSKPCTPTATIALPYGLYQQQISALNNAGISLQPSGNGQFLAFLRPDQTRLQSLTVSQSRQVADYHRQRKTSTDIPNIRASKYGNVLVDSISTVPLRQSATRFPFRAHGFDNKALSLDGDGRSVWESESFQLKRRHLALEMIGDEEHLTPNDTPQSRGRAEQTTLNNNNLCGLRTPRQRKMFEEESFMNRRLSMGDLPHYFEQVKLGDNHESLTEKYLLGRAEIPRRPENGETLGEKPYIRITQVAPSNSSIIDAVDNDDDGNKNWKISLERFSSKKQRDNFETMPKRMKSYYKAQNKLIASYEETQLLENGTPHQIDRDTNTELKKKASLFARITLLVNVCLTIAKGVAVALSGSISITSSLVDSCVDLISGAIFWWTTRAMKRRNPYNYPQGRTKLEPIAIIILSVIMSLAALQLIQESISKIVELTRKKTGVPSVDLPTIGIALGTIVIKLTLYLVCRRVSSSTVQALAMDHRNDVLSNAAAILFGYIGSHQMYEKTGKSELSYLDPIGAILISIYIMVNWWKTGYGQIKLLTGYTAKPVFLSKLTWMCLNHDNNVKQIDTVRAFYFGNNFLVEVDIVLPEEMSLKQAHDIGESLQQKLERLPEVERAFVHLDYECTHDPLSEHKMV